MKRSAATSCCLGAGDKVIYAYGICDADTVMPPPRGHGLGGAKLRVLRSHRLAAIYSRHRSLRARPEPRQVLVHERVVEQMMTRGAVLPLRFGTELQSERDLAVRLEQRADELSGALDRIRGRVELGLRVIPDRQPGATPYSRPRSGREMLVARVEDHRRALHIERQLHAPLTRLAVASTVQRYPRSPAILAASYLVDGERVEAFREDARRLASDQNAMRVLVTGPWPPYSFATEEGQ